MGTLRYRLVLVGLCALVSACTVSTRTPPEPSTGTRTQALGVERSSALELLPSEPDLPIETPEGTVFWDGSEYVVAVPGWRVGLYWFRVPLDGGRPLIHLREDGGQSLGDRPTDSRAIDGGALLLRGSLVRVDAQGSEVARRPFSWNEDSVAMLSAGSQHFLSTQWRDGGASIDEIDVSDGGVATVRTTSLLIPFRGRLMALSGAAVAGLSQGPLQTTIHTFDRLTGASLGSVSAPPNQQLIIIATPSGFTVIWISNGSIFSRRLDRSANWLGPDTLFFPGATPSGLLRTTQLPDAGVLLAWQSGQEVLIAGQGGSATALPVRAVANLSCEGPSCFALSSGTGFFFEPGAPSARAQQLVNVRPWQYPTAFAWNGRIWVVIDEGAYPTRPKRRRLTVFNPDAGRVDDVALLPVLPEDFVIAGSAQGTALTTNGTLFQILTEVDGGVLPGPLRNLVTIGAPVVGPRLFSHEGKFLVMWGPSGNGFTVLDSDGRILVPAQSIPGAVRHDGIGVGTPPGEFWLTYREYPSSPLGVLRIALSDGGLTFETPPGLAIATSPDSMLMETPLGFVLRAHDGGVSGPFGPLRNGPTVWNGQEFQIYPGPSRIVDSGVVDTGLLVPGSSGRVASDGRGTTLATFLDFEWDWLQGETIPRSRGIVVRSADLLLGRACVLDSDCQSAHCVDSVCCNTACGSGADDCQACSVARGSTMPDGVCGPVNRTVVCRWDQDLCDAPEYCDGLTTVCPPDRLHDAGFVCRPVQGLCDVPERCEGVTMICPTDAVSPQGAPCDDDNECTVNDGCDGMYKGWGACEGTARTGACDAGSPCNVGDSCQRGYCIQGPYCPAAECQVSNGCVAAGCMFGPARDGDACDGGSCSAGVCLAGGSDGGAGEDGGASVDGGGTSDGGASRDGGVPVDAGPSDSGVSFDAGAPVDAGRVDSGSPDASTPNVPDSGADDGSDGGRLAAVGDEAGPLASGLGCASSGGSSLAVLAVLLLRRRFRPPNRPAR